MASTIKDGVNVRRYNKDMPDQAMLLGGFGACYATVCILFKGALQQV